MIRGYLLHRENLLNTFILIDSRIEPQQSDLDFMEWLGTSRFPFVIVFTKCDKLKRGELASNVEHYKKVLKQGWDELPQMIISSALDKNGKDEILDFIEETNKVFKVIEH